MAFPTIPQPRPGGFLSGLPDNANMLTMLGLSLLDKRQNNQVPFSQIGQAAYAGSQIDQGRQSRNMTVNWLIKNKKLSQQDAEVAVRNPTILGQYLSGGPKPIAVAEGASLYQPDSGEWLTPPGGGVGKPTDDMREYNLYSQQTRAAGEEPKSFNDWMIGMRRASVPSTESAYDAAVGGAFAKDYIGLQEGARQAGSMIGKLDALGNALKAPGVYTGAGGEAVADLKRVARGLGFEVEGVAEADLARAISNEIALQLRNPAGGAGMPGAMSDKDREFLMSIPPSLSNTPEGNAQKLEMLKRVQQRAIDVAELANQYQAERGRIDGGFYQMLAQWAEANPLFPEAAQTPQAPQAPQAPGGPASDLYNKYGLE